jgi:protein-tyrosine phosphatase
MIDLHSHILPGLDDGARDLEMAVAMARAAVANGITGMVCTPHAMDGVYNTGPDQVLQSVERLQEELDNRAIPLRLYPGQEVHIHYDLLESIRERRVLTVNNAGKYVLLELPALSVPPYTDDLVYELWLNGITPIIAHPERNAAVRRDPAYVRRWTEHGTVLQISSGALTGQFRGDILRLCRRLVRQGRVALIASDAHNMDGRRPALAEAFHQVKRWTNDAYADQLRRNADRVLQGIKWFGTMPLAPPQRLSLPFWRS